MTRVIETATATQPELSVIMPVLNEARTLAEIIARVEAVPVTKEIIVVDDGSSDATPTIADELASQQRVVAFRHDKPRGKGAAIRTAMPHARGRYVIIQDGDLEYDPNDYLALLELARREGAPVVYGSRILHRYNPTAGFFYYLGGRFLSFLTTLLYGNRITDEPTCYKLFRAELLKNLDLRADGFDFCPEVTAKVLRRGLTIREVPIRYHPRSRAEGKKVRLRDALQAAWTLLRLRVVVPSAPPPSQSTAPDDPGSSGAGRTGPDRCEDRPNQPTPTTHTEP